MIKKCRICDGEFFEKPILSLKNMPESAQGFLAYKSDNQTMDINIVQCKFCGTIQLDCEPVSYYRDVIRVDGNTLTVSNIVRIQLQKFINMFNLENKKIVEIGSGNGDFLKIIKEFNVNCLGIEHSQKNINFARKLGLNVVKNFLENENTIIKGAPFDAFVQFNFMEHQPYPNTMIKAIYNNLTCDGVGFVTVPNGDYIFKKGMWYEVIRDHLFYFSKESLHFLFYKNGFDILEYFSTNDIFHNIFIKKKYPLPMNETNLIFDSLKNKIYEYLNNKKNKSIAIWGASHHAFAIISSYGIRNMISFIIDSSPLKQGKFSIGSNIKIISPDEAVVKNIDAIIIMAPVYSNEIENIIINTMKNHISIASVIDDKFVVLR